MPVKHLSDSVDKLFETTDVTIKLRPTGIVDVLKLAESNKMQHVTVRFDDRVITFEAIVLSLDFEESNTTHSPYYYCPEGTNGIPLVQGGQGRSAISLVQGCIVIAAGAALGALAYGLACLTDLQLTAG